MSCDQCVVVICSRVVEVFRTLENLQKFIGLRVQYTFFILKEALNMTEPHPRLSLPPQTVRYYQQICDIPSQRPTDFENLLVFDSVQFAKFWAEEWGAAFTAADNIEGFVAKMRSKANLGSDCTITGAPGTEQKLTCQTFKKIQESLDREGRD